MRNNIARRRFTARPQLKRTIKQQGRLYQWFADQLGVTPGHFSHVLNGKRDIDEKSARFVAGVLGWDFDLLWKVPSGTQSVPSDEQQEAIAS